MTIAAGRLEAQVVIATDQSFEFTWKPPGDVPITQIRSLAAGAYFATELCEAMQDALFGPTVTVTLDGGDLGTGQVTFDLPIVDSFSIRWLTNPLPTVLGFDGDVSGINTATGSGVARGVWIPGTLGKFSRHGDNDPGKLTTDYRQTVGPTGTVHALTNSSYRVHDSIRWEGVPARRAKEHQEILEFESFESFFQDVALGRVAFIPVNTVVRLIWNADLPDEYAEGHLLWPPTHDPEPMILGWAGRYNINLPPLVVEAV